MLDLVDLHLDFGGPPLLAGASARILAGARIGVVGANGCGKTSLLRVLAGELEPQQGHLRRHPSLHTGFLRQELLETDEEQTLRAFVEEPLLPLHDQLQELHRLEERLADEQTPAGERARLLDRYQARRTNLEAAGAFTLERHVDRVLHDLGVAPDAWHRPLSTFSGGERTILAVARLLVTRPDLLLLDEPTNHLDLDGIEWFEEFVRRFEGPVVIVSHDRALLDTCVSEIWELRRGRLTTWPGNYSAYRAQLTQEELRRQRALKVQEDAIARLQFQIQRLKSWAMVYDNPALAKRARSMERRIERMEPIEAPRTRDRRLGLDLRPEQRHGYIAVQIRGYTRAMGARVLLQDAHLEITQGERVALTGPNGSGKTTLLRDLVVQGGWEHPVLRIGKSATLGYFSQLFDDLRPGLTVLEQLQAATSLEPKPAREILHRFLFTVQDLDRAVGTLSGGEKTRLQLAALMATRASLLVLDEPTNHLDVPSREVLEDALDAFDGTLLVVSHDRYFLEKTVHRVVAIEDRSLVSYQCSFAAYRRRQDRRGLAAVGGEGRQQAAPPAEGQGQAAAAFERSREMRRRRRAVTELEEQIEAMEDALAELNREAIRAFEREDHREGAEISARLQACRAQLEELVALWEEASNRLEDSTDDGGA